MRKSEHWGSGTPDVRVMLLHLRSNLVPAHLESSLGSGILLMSMIPLNAFISHAPESTPDSWVSLCSLPYCWLLIAHCSLRVVALLAAPLLALTLIHAHRS